MTMQNEKYILLVEDNQDDVDLTKIVFQKCHIANKLIVVPDGQDALEFLFQEGKYAKREPDYLPHLVILDLRMYLVGGNEVLKKIRADSRTSRVPVVVLTSTDDQAEIKECEELGADHCYHKSTSLEEFQKTIQDIKSRWIDNP